jgi:chemotaxis protein histidine kinase CheA
MKKSVFALLVAGSASVGVGAPFLITGSANAQVPKIPSEITSVMKKAQPFIGALKDLDRSCGISLGASSKMIGMSAMKTVVKKFETLQKGCKGAIVASCTYRATEKDIKTPEKIIKNPLPYANRAAGCIRNTANDIENEKKALKRQAEQIAKQVAKETEAAARLAAQKAENAAKQAAQKAENAAKQAAQRAKQEAERKANEAKNTAKDAGRKLKKVFKF